MTQKSNYDLYIIHGWTYTVEPWTTTLDLLKKAGLRVKMLNVPGLTSPSDAIWTIDQYVDWANANIPDGAIALGHSNGGRILLNLCAKNPDKLKGLILLDSAGVYEPTKKKSLTQKLAKLGAPLKKIKIIDKVFHRLTGTTDYSRAPENMKRTMENMLASDAKLNLSAVTTNTIILWGEADTITPLRHAEVIAKNLPHNTLKTFPAWTHAPYISHPDQLATVLTKLLKPAKSKGNR